MQKLDRFTEEASGLYPFQAAIHLWSGCDNTRFGGWSHVGTLCDPTKNLGISNLFSSLHYKYYIFMHELGHNLGGHHTFEEGKGRTGGLMDYGDGTLNGNFQFNTQYRKEEMCAYMSTVVGKCSGKFGPDTGTEAAGPRPVSSKYTVLTKANKFWRAYPDGNVDAQGETAEAWETWEVEFGFGKWQGWATFKSYHGLYLSAQADGRLSANSTEAEDHEHFRMELNGAQYTIRTYHGLYIGARFSGRLLAITVDPDDWALFDLQEAVELPMGPMLGGASPNVVNKEPLQRVCDDGCEWLPEDNCSDHGATAARCRVANLFLECRNQNGNLWFANENHFPKDVYEGNAMACDCQWMKEDQGFGDNCLGGCEPDSCRYRCRQANPHGTCMAL